MTREQMYAILKEKWEKTDKNDLKAIKAYNKYARELRRQLDEQK